MISVDELIAAIPEIKNVAAIEAIQICNVNSDDITADIWVDLLNTINELSEDENVSEFAITHGTDTLEETAYFLNLTVNTDKPVVTIGAMRPSTSISADGPMNLYQAVCTTASPEAVGKGVLVVFSDKIFSARSVTKTSTYDVTAISAGELGCIEIIRNDQVEFYEEPVKRHTVNSEFSITDANKLGNVSIVYFNVDADPDILKFAAEKSDGLVIAGAGAGEFSEY